MTSNQIELKKTREMERSNRAKEAETKRSNKVRERQERHKLAVDTVATGVKLASVAAAANDPSWYNLDKQMVKDTANVSFDTPLGYKIPNILGTLQTGINRNLYTNPGLCVIRFVPSIGGKSIIGDISAIASKNIYAFVRHANSGARNYEAADLMMYLFAVDQMYSYHAFMRRLYSLALTSKSQNRYYLNAMIEACGVDPDDLRDNLASFRAYINSYAIRANSFYAPNTLSLNLRHYWMNLNIFKDSAIKKSQEYMFLQDSFGVYDDQEGKIKFSPNQFTPGSSSKKTFQALVSLGNSIISGLINSEDAGIMSGDILKAYGESKMFYLEHTSEDFHVESVYNPEVLSQITNATLVGDLISGYDICQRLNNNKLISEIYQGDYLTQSASAQPELSAANLNSNRYGLLANICKAHIGTTNKGVLFPSDAFKYSQLNMYKDDVSNDDLMVASRLVVLPENIQPTTLEPSVGFRANASAAATSETKWGTPLKYFGTEICLTAIIITLTESLNSIEQIAYKTLGDVLLTNGSNAISVLGLIDRHTKCDWAPQLYMTTWTDSTANYIIDTYVSSSYDGANYASLPESAIGNMHYTAVLSEFGVPLLGTTVRSR